MAGMPLRKARKMVAAAKAKREQMVAEGRMTPKERDAANAKDDAYITSLLPGGVRNGQTMPAVPTLPHSAVEPWLIDSPAQIAKAYESRREHHAILRSKRPEDVERIERLLYLVRTGVPIKDTRDSPGAARQCGLHPATVWDWVHTDPEFAARYREARDASSEILEDEMRAMIPSALRHPELVRGLEFAAGRLEWLARVRNRERYGEDKAKSGPQGISFQINLGSPAPAEPRAIEGERVPPMRIKAPAVIEQSATVRDGAQ